MKEPVPTGWDEVFLGEQFDGICDGMEKSQQPESQNIGPIGSNAILHQSALLSLQPGQNEHESHDHVEQEKRFAELNEVFH